MSQKGREKSLGHLFSCHFPTVRIFDDVLICALGKRCPAVARAHSLYKVSVLLKAFNAYEVVAA